MCSRPESRSLAEQWRETRAVARCLVRSVESISQERSGLSDETVDMRCRRSDIWPAPQGRGWRGGYDVLSVTIAKRAPFAASAGNYSRAGSNYPAEAVLTG